MRVHVVLLLAACAGFALSACGGGKGAGSERYPIVTTKAEARGVTITEPSGAIVVKPARPARYEVAPGPTCERMPFVSHPSGKRGTIVVPPAPGLRAKAVSAREVELSWSFRSLPHDCRPTRVLLSIVANDVARATPTNAVVDVSDPSGTGRITYPDFLPPPDVAIASALMEDGRRSRAVKVLIRR